MRILGLDTSSHINAVGLISDDHVLGDFAWEAKNSSLQRIVSAIDFVLGSARLRIEDVDGFAVGIGPGSWTGVRIGLTVGKMLALSCNKPVCGVSSLDALASYGRNFSGGICPIVDAGRGMIYAALYRSRSGVVKRKGEYHTGSITGLLEKVQGRTLFLGDAAHSHHDNIVAALGKKAIFRSRAEDVLRGSAIASLAAGRLNNGESDDALALTPLYLRESAAQALLERKSQKGEA